MVLARVSAGSTLAKTTEKCRTLKPCVSASPQSAIIPIAVQKRVSTGSAINQYSNVCIEAFRAWAIVGQIERNPRHLAAEQNA
jgi:hypothetical protein